MVTALEATRRFVQVETLETFYRPWHIEGAAVRPVQQMVAHTAFLTFGRLVAPPPERISESTEPPRDAPFPGAPGLRTK
jgi:hypothetical protein